jgi:outer membrane autotransporter protein
MDQEVGTSGWRLGGSLGYTNASGKVADRSSESDVNSYSAAVYGGKSFGTGTARASMCWAVWLTPGTTSRPHAA